MKNNNADRVLGVLFALLALASAWKTLTNASFSWAWFGLFFWTVALGVWVWNGRRKIEVGWRGLLTFLGERQTTEFAEGWRWAPFPFGIKTTDCRKQITPLDHLEVFTSEPDNVKLGVEGSLVWHTEDLYKYFSVKPEDIKRGLDDAWDEVVRTQVRELPLDEALGAHVGLKPIATSILRERAKLWGINVEDVLVPALLPDSKVTAELEMKRSKEAELAANAVDAKNINGLIAVFEAKGLDKDRAYEAALVITGKADPKKIFALDSATAAIIAAVLGGKKS